MNNVSIVSIVGTGEIDVELDLDAVAEDIDVASARYDPKTSPGLYIKIREDSPTITIYRTGSINIRGASTFEELNENKKEIEERFEELGINAEISSLNITNIVFKADLDKTLDLNHLAVELGLEDVEYEPEQFPGLVFRSDNGVILIFSSGKVILTGFTSVRKAESAYDNLESEVFHEKF